MTGVLRNVGELASPYYLLELWVRQWEINIDPETYATLKRKTARLVRDARVFEQRGEPVDDDWREARTEILGLRDLDRVDTETEAGAFGADLASVNGGLPVLLIGSLDPGIDPERRDDGSELSEPPATAFELALEQAVAEIEWGLLLCGLELRIYRRGTGVSQQYLALDLEGLVELRDEDYWRAFAGLYRLPSFVPDGDGVPLIQRVVDESRRHASGLAEDMRQDVVEAAELLIQGAFDEPANRPFFDDDGPTLDQLKRMFEETLYVLYRLLFVLYAESRDILPLSAGGVYATTYSLDNLIELARRQPDPPAGTRYCAEAVSRLFELLGREGGDAAEQLGVVPVGGALFDPDRTELFDRLAIPDGAWRAALLALAVGAPGSARGRLGRRSSFAELGVDQLGSIYEGLLVLEPRLVRGPSVLVGRGTERRVLEHELAAAERVVAELAPGTFVLESASGRRKGSGAFYTPIEITEFVTERELAPLVEPLVERAAAGYAREAERELLALRVCDPAMGSGAFLVQAARVLGLALARIRAVGRGGAVTPDGVKRAEAAVVRSCLYGVDLNPLAVELAKVSLWLETLQQGRPLTFLDAHLRTGDSLVGARLVDERGRISLAEVAAWPKVAVKGLATYVKKEGGAGAEEMLAALKRRKAVRGRRQASLPGLGESAIEQALAELAAERERLTGVPDTESDPLQLEVDAELRFRRLERDEEALRNRLRRAADLWCAQWFWPGADADFEGLGLDPAPPPGQADFEALVAHVLNPERTLTHYQRAALDVAERVAAERRFFHWELEFPEVLVEHGGFDAVIGNPPWNTLSPDVKEYFSTYDPLIFRRGVTKAKQEERKAELLDDPEVATGWREEARRLHELSHYVKPASGRFAWFAEEGNLRKGDANVFRLFVERAYTLLREGGHLGQVLPDAFYLSAPATGLRRRLLSQARIEHCFVFENRKKLFPIDSRIKIVLLGAEAGAGPTDDFAAAFLTGKDAAGRERAIGLDELPTTLAGLVQSAPRMRLEEIRTIAPETLAFPELMTPLDLEIALDLAKRHSPLNLDDRGWGLRYCAELHADRDSWLFHTAEQLEELGATRNGLRWTGPDGEEWWPLVEGTLIYHLEFPQEGKEAGYWVPEPELRKLSGRRNPDGTLTMDHYRVAWRDVARAVDERSAIAAVLPPRTGAKHTTPTTWGGGVDLETAVRLAALLSSFAFDYLVRLSGRGHLTHAALSSVPAPAADALASVTEPTARLLAAQPALAQLGDALNADVTAEFGVWTRAEQRARIDARVASAYGLDLPRYAAVLSTFPLLDRAQPKIRPEPKSFVTRDLALQAFCELAGAEPPDVPDLLTSIGVRLPEPPDHYRRLGARLERYRELGAVPYRPTPKGARPPTDPELVAEVLGALDQDPLTGEEVAEAIDEEADVVAKVLRELQKQGECFAQGRGRKRAYYVEEV